MNVDAIFPTFLPFAYFVWSDVYFVTTKGKRIYFILDWKHPKTTSIVCLVLTLMVLVVHWSLVFALDFFRNRCGVEKVVDNLPIIKMREHADTALAELMVNPEGESASDLML